MRKLSFKIAIAVFAVVSVASCKKSSNKAVTSDGAAKANFNHCSAPKTTGVGLHKTTASGGNFVAIGPATRRGTPYYHGVSNSGFPLTPTPTPGGDNIIRDAGSTNPLYNVTGIATDIKAGLCYVLTENAGSPGTWEVWLFPIGDPNNAKYVFTVSGGGSSLSDLEYDYNYSANPGGTRFIALDRSNNALIEIDMSGNVGTSTGYYTSTWPLPTSEVVTGLAWFNCTPTGPYAHSHPFLLSHDAAGVGHLWKCTDNTLENGWSISGAEYTFGNNPANPAAEFGTYFDHTVTQHFVIGNDNVQNTEAVPAGGPGTPYTAPYAASKYDVIDMAEF